jgi:hypothetical protein
MRILHIDHRVSIVGSGPDHIAGRAATRLQTQRRHSGFLEQGGFALRIDFIGERGGTRTLRMSASGLHAERVGMGSERLLSGLFTGRRAPRRPERGWIFNQIRPWASPLEQSFAHERRRSCASIFVRSPGPLVQPSASLLASDLPPASKAGLPDAARSFPLRLLSVQPILLFSQSAPGSFHPVEPISGRFIFSHFRHLSAVGGIQAVLVGRRHFFAFSPRAHRQRNAPST